MQRLVFHERFRLAAAGTLCVAASLVIAAQQERPLQISVSPSAIGPGDVVRIRVDGQPGDRISGSVFGQQLAFGFDAGRAEWRALAGVDLEAKPGTHTMRVVRNGKESATRTITIAPKEFPVRRLKVAPGFVDPSPEALEQIGRDNKLLTAAYAQVTPPRWSEPFLLPVDGRPTSNFGSRSYYNGQARSPHAGVDFMSGTGTPVKSPSHGRVALAALLYFTGNTVIVDHGARLFSVFAHLSAIRVKEGDTVMPEAVVGLVGATGRVTGPHLHWSVRLNGARVDPLSLVAATRN
jgi:murein DD-endopeptidase MepM/ murein hydrolase activator NlpD